MKRFLTILLIAAVVMASAFASDVHFVFERLDLNHNVLKGFCPTVAVAGAGYTGFSFIEGNTTDIQLIVGAGYENARIFHDTDNKQLTDKYMEANDVMASAKLMLKQGLLEDLVTVYAGYEARYDKFQAQKDSEVTTSFDVNAFTNKNGSITSTIIAGATYNGMVDKKTTKDGLKAKVEFKMFPTLGSEKAFFGAEAQAVAGKTLYQIKQDNGLNLFAIGVMDRVVVNATTKNVPLASQRTYSLGSKVRGFERYQFYTNLSAVNNFEIRFVSPELREGLFARAVAFVDCGYAAGKIQGVSDACQPQFLATAGIQAHVSIYDFANVGVEYAYLFNNAKNPIAAKDKKTAMHFTLVLAY